MRLGNHAEIEISLVDGVGTSTIEFVANLRQVFEDSHNWKVLGSRMTEGAGIVIHNKWISSPPIEDHLTPFGVKADPSGYEIDVERFARQLRVANKNLSDGDASVLVALSGALHADLKKDPEEDFVGNDRIRIIIGEVGWAGTAHARRNREETSARRRGSAVWPVDAKRHHYR